MLLRRLVGCHYHIKGRENLPAERLSLPVSINRPGNDGLHTVLKNPVFVLKKALADIPLYGWYIVN